VTAPRLLKILHLEDEPKDALLVEAALEAEHVACEIVGVATREHFAAALERGGLDLILSDFSLPSFDGLRALELARRFLPEVPFIFVSGTIGEESAIAAVQHGATDYVLKHRLSRLAPAVRRAVDEATERERRKESERALARSQEQFRHAQKMEAVGRLAAGVAHDINNVLTAILGFTELARTRLGPAHEVLPDLTEVSEAGERAARLTRQLLAFSRQEVAHPRSLDINGVVRGLEGMLRRVISANVELNTCLDEVGPIMADTGQMEQILMNLVVNACDAMPHGGGLVIATRDVDLDPTSMTLVHELPAGRYVVLTVTDSGTGIAEDVLAHVFEPFFTTKEFGKGTGLGLATVFGIVRQNGGSIGVSSEVGRGTTFALYFPRTHVAIATDMGTAVEEKIEGGSEAILIVEDDEAVRRLAARTLAQWGYELHEAHHGEAALDVMQRGDRVMDLVITDLVMPGMPATEFIAHARELQPDITVLCMSGYAPSATLHSAVGMTDSSLLRKPFTPEALLRSVRDALDRRMKDAA